MSRLTPPEQAVLTLIADAAVKGKRAPTNLELSKRVPASPIHLVGLISKGYIERRWYGRNYRVFIIRRGPEKGRRTNMPPLGYKETRASLRARGAL